MNASAIKDLYYEWCLKILSKLQGPLAKCNFIEFLNFTSSVNPWLLKLLWDFSFIMTKKIASVCMLICTAVLITN